MKGLKIVLVVLVGGLLGYAAPAHAQFIGVSVDGAISYSLTKEPVSGGSIGITHPVPIIPNFGATKFVYEDRQTGGATLLKTKVDATTFNIFYHLPIPIFTLSVGLGVGSLVTTTDVLQNANKLGTVNLTSPIGEGFFRFGVPFLHIFDFHVGYHLVSTGSVDLVKGLGIKVPDDVKTKTNFSGGLTTLGFLIAF